MQHDFDIEPRRPAGWQSLAAAVSEQAVSDLGNRHRLIRLRAGMFIDSPDFADWLDLGGVRIPACEIRAALRGRLGANHE